MKFVLFYSVFWIDMKYFDHFKRNRMEQNLQPCVPVETLQVVGKTSFHELVFEKGMASRSPNIPGLIYWSRKHSRSSCYSTTQERRDHHENKYYSLVTIFMVIFSSTVWNKRNNQKSKKKNSLRNEQFSPVVNLCKVKGISSRHKTRSNKNASEELSVTVCPTWTWHHYQAAAHLHCLNSIKKRVVNLRFDSFRRAWSDINLENLVSTCCDQEEFHNSTTTPNKFQ